MDYLKLCELYEELSKASKRLDKIFLISELLRSIKDKSSRSKVIFLLQGRVFQPWDKRKLGVASRMVIKALSGASGISPGRIMADWKKTGDLGDTASNIINSKNQSTLFSEQLSVDFVFKTLQSISEFDGEGSSDRKIKALSKILTSSKPIEARYIVRTVMEDMRIGVGEGTMRDAICWTYFGEDLKINYTKGSSDDVVSQEERERYNESLSVIQNAFDLVLDFSEVAEIAEKDGIDGLKDVRLRIGRPVRVMLYQKAKDVNDAFERLGKPCCFEYKYDGFRMVISKFRENGKDNVIIYTRRLENVTEQFPEVVEYINNNIDAENAVIDGEAIGYDPKTHEYLPFQNISQRIKRKHNIHDLAKRFPVELIVFDILYYDNNSLLQEPFRKRRKTIEKILKPEKFRINFSKIIISEEEKEAQEFYQTAIKEGFEGVMAKKLDGIYKPGSRVGYGVKIKPTMEPLDLVITKAEWGEGKRSKWLTSFTVACKTHDDELVEIGKVSSGLKELEEEGTTFAQMTSLLSELKISEKDKTMLLKPGIVIEVGYEEIQKSPTYSSGYALRFPRIIRLREDRGPDEIADMGLVDYLFELQKKSGF